jgi:hypothetical protein
VGRQWGLKSGGNHNPIEKMEHCMKSALSGAVRTTRSSTLLGEFAVGTGLLQYSAASAAEPFPQPRIAMELQQWT